LAPGSIERQGPTRHQGLSQRVFLGRYVDKGQGRPGTAQAQLDVGSDLHETQPLIVEGAGSLRKGRAIEPCQRRPAAFADRGQQETTCVVRLVEHHSPAAFDCVSTEAQQVALLLRNVEAVATRRRGQPVSAHPMFAIGIERVAPVGDVALHQVRSRSRCILTPHSGREEIGSDDAIRRKQEECEQRLSPAAAISDQTALAADFERSQQPELDRGHSHHLSIELRLTTEGTKAEPRQQSDFGRRTEPQEHIEWVLPTGRGEAWHERTPSGAGRRDVRDGLRWVGDQGRVRIVTLVGLVPVGALARARS